MSPTQVTLVFIANRASHKFDEIENDGHVNVSFFDESSTNWASYSGIAKISQDKEKIAKHWNTAYVSMHHLLVPRRSAHLRMVLRRISAWFGDLGDGVHKGDQNDPRVAIIEVVPNEIRYWMATRGAIGQTVDVAVSAITGKTAAPGELRTITKDEVSYMPGRRRGTGMLSGYMRQIALVQGLTSK